LESLEGGGGRGQRQAAIGLRSNGKKEKLCGDGAHRTPSDIKRQIKKLSLLFAEGPPTGTNLNLSAKGKDRKEAKR